MTVYNGDKFIYQALKSIINQSYDNWNAIIIDDKSTDNSVRIIKENFKDKRIKLIKLKKHVGRTNALILGLKKCKGEFTAIMDADDISHHDRFKKQIKFLKKNLKIKMVGSWIYKVDKYSKRFGTLKPTTNICDLNSQLLFLNVLSHSSLMFYTNLAKKYNGYPKKLKYAQDYGLILKFLKYESVAVIPNFLISNRFQEKSMTYTHNFQKQIAKDQNSLLIYVKNNFKLNHREFFKYLYLRVKFFFKLLIYSFF